MKTIHVVAAVICDSFENKSRIFATARGYGELKEAEAAKWLAREQLDSVAWLPADVTLIEKIKSYMK